MSHDTNDPIDRSFLETVLHYVAILLRYKWFIIIVSVIATGGIVVYLLRTSQLPPEDSPMPNVYRAEARLLLLDEAQDSVTTMLRALGAADTRSGAAGSGRIILEVLYSRSFIDTIIEQNEMIAHYGLDRALLTRRRQFVRSKIGGQLDAATGILRITYTDIRPQFAMQTANSIVDELDRYFRERGGMTRNLMLETLERTLADAEQRTTEIESEIRAFQERYGVLTVQELATSQSAMTQGLEADLIELERRIRIAGERTRITDDPELIRLRSERNIVADMIRRIEDGYAGGDRTMPPRSRLPELYLELSRLRADLEIQQRIRTSLQQQYEVAKLGVQGNTGFTILEYAEVPEMKIGPDRGPLAIRYSMMAFAASIALSFLHYGYKSIRKNPQLMEILRASRRSKKNAEQ